MFLLSLRAIRQLTKSVAISGDCFILRRNWSPRNDEHQVVLLELYNLSITSFIPTKSTFSFPLSFLLPSSESSKRPSSLRDKKKTREQDLDRYSIRICSDIHRRCQYPQVTIWSAPSRRPGIQPRTDSCCTCSQRQPFRS